MSLVPRRPWTQLPAGLVAELGDGAAELRRRTARPVQLDLFEALPETALSGARRRSIPACAGKPLRHYDSIGEASSLCMHPGSRHNNVMLGRLPDPVYFGRNRALFAADRVLNEPAPYAAAWSSRSRAWWTWWAPWRVQRPPVRVRCPVAFSLSATFAHERPAARCSMMAASVSCSPWCHARRITTKGGVSDRSRSSQLLRNEPVEFPGRS